MAEAATESQVADILSVARFLLGLVTAGVMVAGFFIHANLAAAALGLVVLAMLMSIASDPWLQRLPARSDSLWGATLADMLFLLLAALGIGFSRQHLSWVGSLATPVLMAAWIGIIALNSKNVLLWNRVALVCSWTGALASLIVLPLYASAVFRGHMTLAYLCLGVLAVMYGTAIGRRMVRLVLA